MAGCTSARPWCGPLGPRPGTHVPVRFDPDDPSRAMIDTYVQSGRILYAIGGALLGWGSSCCSWPAGQP